MPCRLAIVKYSALRSPPRLRKGRAICTTTCTTNKTGLVLAARHRTHPFVFLGPCRHHNDLSPPVLFQFPKRPAVQSPARAGGTAPRSQSDAVLVASQYLPSCFFTSISLKVQICSNEKGLLTIFVVRLHKSTRGSCLCTVPIRSFLRSLEPHLGRCKSTTLWVQGGFASCPSRSKRLHLVIPMPQVLLPLNHPSVRSLNLK